MGKKHEQDLRLVEGVVAAQLAERDAEIERLRAQVAELEAWKAAVPVATLRGYVDKTDRIKSEMYSRQYLYEDFLTDRYVIDQWLATFDAMAPD